ncbi:MAG TPA: hypothetical protein VFR50_02355 [Casimicrobiaceae bacterium]|jgi:hypothetical protein|nr:hypothetical protein [Casimicrobiaceae bacterium]
MVTRRLFRALAIAYALPMRAQAQSTFPRIGYMALPTSAPNVRLATFRQALHELGYVEGRNVAIEYRSAEGNYDRFLNPRNESMRVWRQQLPLAAGKLGVDLLVEEARTIAEIEAAFDSARRTGADSMIIFDDALFYAQAARIGSLAARRRLP